MNKYHKSPILFIDLKKNRIRIHRYTLQLLGNPEYIQILVNPEAGEIAVRRTVMQGALSHKVASIHLGSQKSYELYSKKLLRELSSISYSWREDQSYQLYGTLVSSHQLVRFPFRDAIPAGKDSASFTD